MFDKYHHAALNTALLDRTRLATALYRLVAAIQIEHTHVSIALLQAEAEAVTALQSVGGIDGVTEPAVAEI